MDLMLITFEGLDYSGKSTQIQLLSSRLAKEGKRTLVLREPGGTGIGEKIRSILLDKKNGIMTETTEILLFEASRAQLTLEVIIPALKDGTIVICDRYFDSTTVYQGYGRGIAMDFIDTINRFATAAILPDLTFFLDIPVEEIGRRMKAANTAGDRMESNDAAFYTRVRDGYLKIAKTEKRFRVIDGLQPVQELHDRIWNDTMKSLNGN
jgi:dTMP kinase